jgi:uncharacterized protein YdeI (YjbR/CyaY-like superfamily)
MGTRDPRVDAYIARSADFARPILAHVREIVHAACPEIVETMKWSFPHFTYRGLLCSMAAFKQHCTFGFWRGSLILNGTDPKAREAMGNFGRITRLSDLPSKRVLAGYVKAAMRLNEAGVRPSPRPRRPKQPLRIPADVKGALAGNAKAQATFDGFSPSQRREYVEWITEAKTPETRSRRLVTAVEWMAEGKSRNWKYLNC